jgi:molecular chaperone DnaK
MASTVFGIDFGTSNSAVVLYEVNYKHFTNIGDEDNNPIPSVVAIDRLTQEVWCGRKVKQHILELRDRERHFVIDSIKTRLASDETWLVGRTTWNAEKVAGELFRFLSRSVEMISGSPIREAVVAIPIGLGLKKRKAIRKAAELAGIKVLDFVSEPTAAFMGNARDLGHCKYVTVFDWGGGTLDISVLEVAGDCITERYTDGWPVAGDEIDKKFAEWIHSQLTESHGLRIAFENIAPNERQNLINQAEDCKCRFQCDDVEQQMVRLGRYAGISPVELLVKKEEFEDLISPAVVDSGRQQQTFALATRA